MRTVRDSPRNFAVAAYREIPEAAGLAATIAEYLRSQGCVAHDGFLDEEMLRHRVSQGDYDILIAVGGDGTMLRAGHLCAPAEVPILGINLGRFGFLIEVQRDQWQEALTRVLAADYWLEERMMLLVRHVREDQVLGEWEALNECVVSRGDVARPVHLVTEIDNRHITTYVADGIIVATATGSTAYALAAGGPILPPELRNILLVPVAPHLSVDRSVVLHEGSVVRITVQTRHNTVLSVDGQLPVQLKEGDQVVAGVGGHTASFVRLQDPAYFYRNLTSRMSQNPSAKQVP